MLVLSRKPEEKIRIGEDVIIQVVEIHKGRVRLGITAPKSIRIVRDEIADRAAIVIDDDVTVVIEVPTDNPEET